MEIHLPGLLLLASLFISASIFLKLRSRFQPKHPTPNLPPGPPKLPLIGNMHNLIGAVPHLALHQLSLKHGPLMHLRLGELDAVVVSSPESAKQVMKTHDINFATRPPIAAAEIMSYGCTSITFGPYGDYWRQLRRICTLELLSAKRVQSFRSLREQVYTDAVRSISTSEGSPVNLTAKLHSATYAVTSKAAVGKATKEREALLPILKEALELAGGFDIAEVFPSLKVLEMVSGLRKKLRKYYREVDRILENIVDEHRAAGSGEGDDGEDLLDVLLKYQDEGMELPLTTDNIKSVILDMLAAGSETSATTMDWAMAEMLKNPRVLDKAQTEVRQVFDENGYVDESSIHQLPYLKSIVKEVLRLHPPLPLLLPRKCRQTCEINGYTIPENTKIIVNAWAINRDPEYWSDADCFEPERFVDSAVDNKGNHFEYIPFGAGRRVCPGMSFGLANVELPLAMFLYHFDWSLEGSGGEVDMAEGFGLTNRRKNDIWVVPVVRRPVK